MIQVMTDIWPFLVTAIIAVVGWQFREGYLLKTKVAVMEKSIDALQDTIKAVSDNTQRSIEHLQKRQDSHSKKQDDIMTLLTNFKVEVLREVGEMSSSVNVLAADVKNLSALISQQK